jgi:uncharacterized repeat protein (TIGR03803 family)
MLKSGQRRSRACTLTSVMFALAGMVMLAVVATQAAQARTFTVLHTFIRSDGVTPYGGLTRDKAGNLYGTTEFAGNHTAGNVFKVDPTGRATVLYSFTGRSGDGKDPLGTLLRDQEGNLYGTTRTGVGGAGCGIVFKIDTTGKETRLHHFSGSDGCTPRAGLISDGAGKFYGTTATGGNYGVVFQLSNGKETVLYTFTGTDGDGAFPYGALVRDGSGNLYGTTLNGGDSNNGTVFKLDITGKETILHSFNGTDGASPQSALILDQAGNLYGTAGTVFKIDTAGNNFSVLYAFSGGADGSEAYGALVMDKAGNLYGTTVEGGSPTCNFGLGCGVVFKLDTTGKETVLHRFSGGKDGALPASGLIHDSAGNLYGTAPRGGSNACNGGCGVVFKIRP